MRTASLVLVLLLAGCATTPFASTSGQTATVTVRERAGYPFSAGHNGITEVDGRSAPGNPARTVTLKPGLHTLTFSCPGWLSIDGFPELSHTFQAGSTYELDCGKEPHFELIR